MESDYQKAGCDYRYHAGKLPGRFVSAPQCALCCLSANPPRIRLLKCGIRTIEDWLGSLRRVPQTPAGQTGETPATSTCKRAGRAPPSPLRNRRPKSVRHDITFRRAILWVRRICSAWAQAIADNVAARLRRMELKCSTVQILIKGLPNLKKHFASEKGWRRRAFLAKELAQAGWNSSRRHVGFAQAIRMLSLCRNQFAPAEQAAEQLSLFGNVSRH